MKFSITRALIFALILFGVSHTASAQLVSPAPPAVAPPTIWNRLGIPYGFNKIRDNRINRRGNNPQWERTPRLKAIADPANLISKNPAIARAAEIKQAEDLAPQKIKAIKYLAQIGCGCYDKDGSITAALVKALDPVQECTPDVRLATIEAIQEGLEEGNQCQSCGSTGCCNEEIALALSKSAYERGDDGCFLEPNAEVREAAAELLRLCCPGRGPVNIIEAPDDGSGGGVIESPEVPEVPDTPPTPDDVTSSQRNHALHVMRSETPQRHSPQAPAQLHPVEGEMIVVEGEAIELAQPAELIPSADDFAPEENYEGIVELAAPPSLPVQRAPVQKFAAQKVAARQVATQQVAATPTKSSRLQAPRPTAAPAAKKVQCGEVAHVDAQTGVIHLQFAGKTVMPVGTKLTVYHEYLTGPTSLGEIEVVQTTAGAAIARPVGLAKTWKIARGDQAVTNR